MTRKRKSLDETLAHQFVYGETTPSVSIIESLNNTSVTVINEENSSSLEDHDTQNLQSNNNQTSSNIMEQLKVSPKEGTKRFTVDLSESLHRKLSILSAQTGRSKADIVRMLLEDTFKNI